MPSAASASTIAGSTPSSANVLGWAGASAAMSGSASGSIAGRVSGGHVEPFLTRPRRPGPRWPQRQELARRTGRRPRRAVTVLACDSHPTATRCGRAQSSRLRRRRPTPSATYSPRVSAPGRRLDVAWADPRLPRGGRRPARSARLHRARSRSSGSPPTPRSPRRSGTRPQLAAMAAAEVRHMRCCANGWPALGADADDAMGPFVHRAARVPRPDRAVGLVRGAGQGVRRRRHRRPTSTARWPASSTRRPGRWCSRCSRTPGTRRSPWRRSGPAIAADPRLPAGSRCGDAGWSARR